VIVRASPDAFARFKGLLRGQEGKAGWTGEKGMGRREWQERKEERKGEGEKNEGRGKGRIDFGLLQLHHGWR